MTITVFPEQIEYLEGLREKVNARLDELKLQAEALENLSALSGDTAIGPLAAASVHALDAHQNIQLLIENGESTIAKLDSLLSHKDLISTEVQNSVENHENQSVANVNVLYESIDTSQSEAALSKLIASYTTASYQMSGQYAQRAEFTVPVQFLSNETQPNSLENSAEASDGRFSTICKKTESLINITGAAIHLIKQLVSPEPNINVEALLNQPNYSINFIEPCLNQASTIETIKNPTQPQIDIGGENRNDKEEEKERERERQENLAHFYQLQKEKENEHFKREGEAFIQLNNSLNPSPQLVASSPSFEERMRIANEKLQKEKEHQLDRDKSNSLDDDLYTR